MHLSHNDLTIISNCLPHELCKHTQHSAQIGLLLASYFSFPIYIFLAETRSQSVFTLAVFLAVIGISWNTVTSTLIGPPKYKLVKDAPGGNV